MGWLPLLPSRPGSLATVENPIPPPNTAPAATSAEMPSLRSQAEFFMTGVLPVSAQPEAACSTCLELLTDDVVMMVKCGHMFHCTCILPWFQSRSPRRGACPNCRTELFEPDPLRLSYGLSPSRFAPVEGMGRGGPVRRVSMPEDPYTDAGAAAGAPWRFSGAQARTNLVDRVRQLQEDLTAVSSIQREDATDNLLQTEHERSDSQRARRLRGESADPGEATETHPRYRPPVVPREPYALRDVFAPLTTDTIESLLHIEMPAVLRQRYEEELALRRMEANAEAAASMQTADGDDSPGDNSSGDEFPLSHDMISHFVADVLNSMDLHIDGEHALVGRENDDAVRDRAFQEYRNQDLRHRIESRLVMNGIDYSRGRSAWNQFRSELRSELEALAVRTSPSSGASSSGDGEPPERRSSNSANTDARNQHA